MYQSLGGMYRGWSRIFYGTFVTFRRIALSLAAVLVVSMAPYAIAAMAWALWAAGTTPPTGWLACAIAATTAVAAQLLAIWRFYVLLGVRSGMFGATLSAAVWRWPAWCRRWASSARVPASSGEAPAMPPPDKGRSKADTV